MDSLAESNVVIECFPCLLAFHVEQGSSKSSRSSDLFLQRMHRLASARSIHSRSECSARQTSFQTRVHRRILSEDHRSHWNLSKGTPFFSLPPFTHICLSIGSRYNVCSSSCSSVGLGVVTSIEQYEDNQRSDGSDGIWFDLHSSHSGREHFLRWFQFFDDSRSIHWTGLDTSRSSIEWRTCDTVFFSFDSMFVNRHLRFLRKK